VQKRTKCNSCGGDLEFVPSHNYLKCKLCDSKLPIKLNKDIVQHDFDLEATKLKVVKSDFKKCNSCGATLNAEEFDILKKCSYCSSTNFSTDFSKISADAILPFQFNKDDAKVKFKNHVAKKSLVPNKIKKNLPVLDIEAKYFTCYVFNGNSKVGYSGTLEYRTEDSDGDTVYRTKRVSGHMDFPFNNYLIEASDDMSQYDFEQIAPYSLSKSRNYSYEYLLGSNAEIADISPSQANERFIIKLRKSIEKLICKMYHCDRVEDLDMSIEFSEKKYSRYLVPCYVFNFDYKNKKYLNLMNGETGKITGTLPKSPFKIFFRVFIVLLAVLGIIGLMLL